MIVGRAVAAVLCGDVYVTEMLGVTILSSLISSLLSSHFIFHSQDFSLLTPIDCSLSSLLMLLRIISSTRPALPGC